ncbi:hypothetical protein J8F10_13515 [Gemmata sp. G18]|uniref:Uncharacterized protein n=1 Tax=Gemmata palustris TaxID=2822762 RepID=A0ABS5BRJ7_9BACT|nr:phage portal protein [Gemmata palustris]MBP3956303.1 hypothetical protein [Gemmata palustris]
MPATHTRLRTPGPTHEPQGLAPLRRELVAQNRRLRETLLNLDNLISPADWLDAGDGFPGFGTWRWNRPATRAQDRTHAPLSYLNEEEWRHHVALARDLVTRNHLALGFRDHVANFVGPVSVSFVLKGQAPGASASGPIDADGDGEPDLDPIVKEATQAWDEWRELAEWGEGEHDREAECRTRLIVEGECTLRFFTGNADSNGLPHVRHVEPELIRTPPGHDTTGSWGWGIKCADDDDECEDALWLCRPDNPNDGREVAASEYVRAKANVDRTVKRGLSDFFSVAEHLRKVLGLLDNMGHVARLQSAIAWWEQYPNATEAQVRAMIQSGTDYSRPKLAPGAPARTTDVQNYEPGSVIRTEAGRQVQPGPVATGVAGYAQVEALLLRAVGFRWGCPSYFSGDADASFASVLVTGSPFVRITEARQEKVKGFARAVARRVLEFCERTGRLPRGTTQRVRPIATARPVVIADEEKQARTFLALYQQNCADPIDFMRKRGDDPKVVAANIAAWHKKFPPPGTGADALPVGDDLNPSPPGSAGGDGTSPNDSQPLGEARFFRGNKNKKGKGHKGKNEGDVWHGPSGRWFTLKNGHVVPAKAPGARVPLKSRMFSTPTGGSNPSDKATGAINAAKSNNAPASPPPPRAPSAPPSAGGTPAPHAHRVLENIPETIIELRRQLADREALLAAAHAALAAVPHSDKLARNTALRHTQARLSEKIATQEEYSRRSREHLISTLGNPSGAPIPAPIYDAAFARKVKPAVDEAMTFLGKMQNGEPPAGPVYIGQARSSRAEYDPNSKRLLILGKSDAPTICHEYGHHLEIDPGVLTAANRLWTERFHGTAEVNMKTAFPDKPYTTHEKGRWDKTNQIQRLYLDNLSRAAYIGKRVKSRTGTELISSGMELLYNNPLFFAETDPGYFNLVVGVLRGEHDRR